ENLFVLVMALFSQESVPTQNPGRFTSLAAPLSKLDPEIHPVQRIGSEDELYRDRAKDGPHLQDTDTLETRNVGIAGQPTEEVFEARADNFKTTMRAAAHLGVIAPFEQSHHLTEDVTTHTVTFCQCGLSAEIAAGRPALTQKLVFYMVSNEQRAFIERLASGHASYQFR
ncbi:hypothetical protein, partial [Robbsia andropogonis]|uniref:hypothetical protein n=1 Tax=Robbsia andropogonis TaxID=28092 RepID=UPI00209F8275